VSLAALIGIDARILLTTDDIATHVVYDKVIEQTREWAIKRTDQLQHNQAVLIINQLGIALGRKRA
jgi:hypothetical protein